MNVQVRIPDDMDAERLAQILRLAVLNTAKRRAVIEVGQGQRINGIPLNTILLTIS